jgi:cell division protein FtsQ
MASRTRSVASRVGVFLLLAALAALAGFGWQRAQTLPLTGVEVVGAVHADEGALLALAAVPDSARLFGVDPLALASRVEAEPWVRRARVSRSMRGVIRIRVEERQPVALALGSDGRASAFVDATGHAMPATATALAAGYDVPLLTGRLPGLRPGEAIQDPALVRLLATLSEATPLADALVSAVERRSDGTLVLVTAPTPAGAALPVVLGRDGFTEKLRRLEAFWEQAILTRPDHPIRRVDLRFDGQIVTDEGS